MPAPKDDRAGIRQTIKVLLDTGHTLLYVNNGGDDEVVKTAAEALEECMAADEAYLHVQLPQGLSTGWVRFVLGNDPEEVVCDFTVNLDVVDRLTTSWN